MADAFEILKDPAYTSANDVTKRAIFDKHIASDPAYAEANEPTRLAIQKKFGLTIPSLYSSAVPQLDAQGQLIRQPDAIPEARTPDRGLMDYAVGALEVPFNTLANIPSNVIAPFAAVAGEYLGGINTPQGKAKGAQYATNVSKFQLTPQTQTAKDIIDYAGEKLEGVDLNAIPFAQGSTVAALGPAAARQLPSAIKNEAGYLKGVVNEIPSVKAAREKTAAANLVNSYENASRIEAAQIGGKYGLLMDPEVSNPSTGAKVRGAIVGERNISNNMAEQNQPTITAKLKEEVGIPLTKKLDEATFKEAHAAPEITQPYEKVKAIPRVQIGATTLDDLEGIKRTALIGEESKDTLHIAKRLDNLKADVLKGGNGDRFLTSVRQLRKEAQDIYRKKDPLTPLERREAEAIMKAADILEGVLTDNLPVIKDRDAFLKARTAQAKLYQLEEATDLANGVTDPRVFAKMINDKRPITGVARDMGLFAASFPDFVTPTGKGGWTFPRLTRATAPGMIGGTLGLLAAGPVGAPFGIALGSGIGELGKRALAKNMLTPEFQAKNAVPTDYRPAPFPTNNLRPVTPGQSNIVPFNPVNALLDPEIRPNFVFGKSPIPSDPFLDVKPLNVTGAPGPEGPNRPFARSQPAQLSNDTPAEVIARRRAEDARQTRMAQIAESEGLAAETSNRRPAKDSVNAPLYELDKSGRLVPVDQSAGGPVTLEAVPTTLRSAVDKLSSQSSTFTPTDTQKFRTGKFDETGRPIYAYRQTSLTPTVEKSARAFDLTADELAVWNNTRASIDQLSPGYKALSDKEIVSRMMDRKWVEGAVAKARDQARAFEEIAQRAKTDADIFAAQASREKMLDVAAMMEENLRAPRADASRKQQGPKTRAEIRNNLTANQNRNKLRED